MFVISFTFFGCLSFFSLSHVDIADSFGSLRAQQGRAEALRDSDAALRRHIVFYLEG